MLYFAIIILSVILLMPTPFVSVIGSGNLAWHLAPALDNAGFVVKEVFSRNPVHAEALTDRLYQAEVKATLDFSTSDSRVFFIITRDDAVQEIAREIVLPEEALLVHTSGSQPLSALQFAATSRLGVFYPLQTLSKSRKIDFRDIPLFIESSDEATGRDLLNIGKAISSQVKQIGSQERKALHIAAVFASNFVNHMLTLSGDVLRENSLDFKWLLPLITETISKSLSMGPSETQTGPARRGDLEVLDAHLEFLKDDMMIAEIYRVISQHIVDRYAE
jgi:predicted short-subunit dehydrogenase-like oxidoreductase (DUF2520 family)